LRQRPSAAHTRAAERPAAATLPGVRRLGIPALHLAERLYPELGRWDEANAHFAHALDVHERMGAPSLAARTTLDWGTALRRDGLLLRTYKDGQSKLNGYLEDYAFLADGLLALYEATFDTRWLSEAHTLAETMVTQFWDEADGGFFDTGRDHEALIARPKSVFDNAIPAGNSVAVSVLQRLAVIFDDDGYAAKADRVLRGLHLGEGLETADVQRARAAGHGVHGEVEGVVVRLGVLRHLIRTPRDVARYVNSVALSYPGIRARSTSLTS